MKNLILTICMLLISCVAFAQKPKLGKIESLFKAGKIAEAKDQVDLAVDYEKTKGDPKTYYLKGLIYAAIDTAELRLVDNPFEIAIAAFQKSDEMNTSDKELFISDNFGFPVTFTQHVNGYWTFYFNKAIASYEEGNGLDDDDQRVNSFLEATNFFETAQKIIPADTNGYMYAGYAAVNAKQPDRAVTNFQKAIDAGASSVDLYNYYAYVLGTDLQDLEGSLAIIRQARELYPNDSDLRKSEITILIKLDKIDAARAEIEETLKKEPGNIALWFTLGVMYDELMDKAEKDSEARTGYMNKAKESYTKAIEIDETFYDAQFNLGVLVFNEARNILQEISNLGISKADQAKERKLLPLANDKLKEALPQWEKLNSLRPEERVVLETLQLIYTRLKMYDKAEKVMDQLDKMESDDN